MKQDLNKLREKYPKVFPHAISLDEEKGTNFKWWGFECGPGWYEILDSAGLAITALIKQAENDKKKLKFETLQIKEKFGDLRWYYRCSDKRVDGIILMAEVMSSKTCEKCGKPGAIDTEATWYAVLCKRCRNKK